VSVRRGERGAALLTALLVLFLVSIALALLATALQIRMRLVVQEAEALQLGALSDAALAEALHGLTYDANFSGHAEHPFGAGSLASEVESLGGNRYLIRATGIYRDQRRTVEARAVRAPGGARVTEWRRVRE
jgi:hypothetical protein